MDRANIVCTKDLYVEKSIFKKPFLKKGEKALLSYFRRRGFSPNQLDPTETYRVESEGSSFTCPGSVLVDAVEIV